VLFLHGGQPYLRRLAINFDQLWCGRIPLWAAGRLPGALLRLLAPRAPASIRGHPFLTATPEGPLCCCCCCCCYCYYCCYWPLLLLLLLLLLLP
jgi:hypothetical protein